MGLRQEFHGASRKRRTEIDAIRSGVASIRTEVAGMLRELAREDAKRRSEIDAIRSGVATMRSEVADMLEELAKPYAERRSKVTDYMRSEVSAIFEEILGKAPAEKKGAPVVREKPVSELRDRVFAYLANHPNGTKLTELEEKFGVARIQMARVVRELMDSNKVEKREQFYFAI